MHYLHDSTIPPKSHFCPIIYQSPIGPMGLKLRMLKDLAYLNGMPFTALQNSYWFGTYEFFKIAKSSLKIFLSDSDSSFQRFSSSDFWPTSSHRRITKFGTQLLCNALQGWFLENSEIYYFFNVFRLFESQDLGGFMAAIRGNFISTFNQLSVIAALSNLVWSFYAMIPNGPRWKFLGFQFFSIDFWCLKSRT